MGGHSYAYCVRRRNYQHLALTSQIRRTTLSKDIPIHLFDNRQQNRTYAVLSAAFRSRKSGQSILCDRPSLLRLALIIIFQLIFWLPEMIFQMWWHSLIRKKGRHPKSTRIAKISVGCPSQSIITPSQTASKNPFVLIRTNIVLVKKRGICLRISDGIFQQIPNLASRNLLDHG